MRSLWGRVSCRAHETHVAHDPRDGGRVLYREGCNHRHTGKFADSHWFPECMKMKAYMTFDVPWGASSGTGKTLFVQIRIHGDGPSRKRGPDVRNESDKRPDLRCVTSQTLANISKHWSQGPILTPTVYNLEHAVRVSGSVHMLCCPESSSEGEQRLTPKACC